MGLREIRQLISLQLEFFDLYVSLENIGNFGIKEQPNEIFFEGQFNIMMVGAVDYKIKVDFNDFHTFIVVGDGNCQGLFMQFLKRGGKVHFGWLIPLHSGSIYGDLIVSGRLHVGCFGRLHLRYKCILLAELRVENIFDKECDSEVLLREVRSTSEVEKMITFARSNSNSC